DAPVCRFRTHRPESTREGVWPDDIEEAEQPRAVVLQLDDGIACVRAPVVPSKLTEQLESGGRHPNTPKERDQLVVVDPAKKLLVVAKERAERCEQLALSDFLWPG